MSAGQVLTLILGLALIASAIYFLLTIYSRTPGTPEERIDDLIEGKYSPDMNRFAAWAEGGAAKGRGELLGNLNQEASQLVTYLEKIIKLRQLRLQQLGMDDAFRRQEEFAEATHNLQLLLMGSARRTGLPLENYIELQSRFFDDKLELDKNWQAAMQGLKAGFTYQLEGYQHLELLLAYINKLYAQRRELEAVGKTNEFKLLNEHIVFMEENFRERQRIVQGTVREGNGEEVGPGNENPDNSERSRPAEEAT